MCLGVLPYDRQLDFQSFFFLISCQSNVAMSKSHDESGNFRAD